MIGIVVAGHGTFASGMKDAVTLLAGKPEYFEAVDFALENSTDDLEFHLKDVIESMKGCDGILICTDVLGGSPFKEAAELSEELADKFDIRILCGTNLGMLIQADSARGYVNDVDMLADLTEEEGKKQIVKYVFSEKTDNNGDI
ncbi:MAG: PTS fructose transporter subunit IIA [Solobacterium sp.]|jgi:PTS system N-acetylgalactosamine-specific IIA component|nr:PTS fructose transporter subunit IIA [Solobacterium sp.]MCH4204928.1 PTS fructose transporter subunit IIA [Solobacterium sp.]MCH4226320.1 PTS fructose transporter subunit IIA [Solobacterium sp.]MCH4281721.1 PTS fructose transporter subunit IIA [Solobacterium sp.]